MRLRRALVLAALAGAVAAAPAAASGGFSFSEFPIAAAPGDQSDPSISGPYVVYSDETANDLYYFDATDGSTHLVAAGEIPGLLLSGDVSGHYISFTGSNGWAADVFLYDIPTGLTAQVTATSTQELNPAVSSDLVAYESYTTGDANLCVDRISGGATTCLPEPGDQVLPAASGMKVAYIDTNVNGAVVVYDVQTGATTTIFPGPATSVAIDGAHAAYAYVTQTGVDLAVYDLVGGTTETLSLPGDQINPHISGDWVSFEDLSSGASHIGLWDWVTGEVEHPNLGPSSQTLSGISGNRVVYTDDRSGALDIYGFAFTPPSADTTPPVLQLPATITTVATNPAGAVVTYTATATDDTDPHPTVSCSPASGSTFPIGTTTVACSATDAAGNLSTGSFGVVVQYASGGSCDGAPGHQILQPINADGSSVFKQGSTVAAKFRVCDANGVSIGTPGVVTDFRLVETIAGGVSTVNEAVTSTTPDTAFRWDPTAQQWIFNIATKSLAANTTYVYRISLDDGSAIDFHFALK
jgi:HYR domain